MNVTRVLKVISEKPDIERNKIKVAAYCRVSSTKEIQETSYFSQLEWYNKLIQSNAEWEFVGIFADFGKSGLKRENRIEFNNMIKKALNNEIDLILTKSISRFSRNTVDTLDVIRKL